MKDLMGLPVFRRLLAAVTLTTLANSLLILVVGIWVKTLTESDSAAGLVIFVIVVPTVLSPLLGAVIDRLPRRAFLIGVNIGSALVLVPMLLVTDADHVWVIYASALLYGFSFPFFAAGNAGIIKEVVPDEQVSAANGAMESIRQGMRLVGPLAGAGLFAAVGPHAVVWIAMTLFVVAAVAMLFVRAGTVKPDASDNNWREELIEGLHSLWHNTQLRPVALGAAVALAGIGAFEPAIYAIVDEGLGQEPTFVSVIVFTQSIGAVVGGLTASRVIARLGERLTFSIAMVVVAIGTALFIAPTMVTAFVGSAVLGIAFTTAVVAMQTVLVRTTPEALIGRVSTAVGALVSGPQTLGIAASAAMLAVVGFHVLMVATMLIVGVVGLVMLVTARRQIQPALTSAGED